MKNNLLVVPTVLLVCLSAVAQEPQPSSEVAAQQQTAPAPDKNIEMLAADLHALARVADLSADIHGSRQVLLAITDSDIETLRMPRGDGTYTWASLQREEGGRVKDEKAIEYVHTEKELREVTVTAPNAYRVEVIVPRKRNAFSANNRVYVRNVFVDSTGFDGKVFRQEIPVNAWVEPGDATGTPLADIAKSAIVMVELGVESGNKAAVAEVSVVQAKLVDDPNSPYFPAVKRLLQVRDLVTAKDINRGALKNTLDEALLSLPGQLEKRTAEMAEAARVRKMMAEAGTTTGSINLGDATPDVVNELAAISRMLTGTLEEQTEARAKLEALTTVLKPAAPQP